MRFTLISTLLIFYLLVAPTLGLCPETEIGLTSWPYGTASDITIPSGKNILLDRSITLNSLIILPGAKLVVKPNSGIININAAYIIVYGSFIAGSSDCSYKGNLNIFLTNPLTIKTDIESTFGKKVLAVGSEGTLHLYGEKLDGQHISYTKLISTMEKGATTLSVRGPIATWKVGHEIVVSSTSSFQQEAETFTITAISGSGLNVLTLNKPSVFRHNGVGGRADERAEVSNLYRNIKIEGVLNGNDVKTGGHVIFRSGFAGVYVSYVAFTKLGQQGSLGRYPVHFHAAGNVLGKNLIEGCSIYRNIQRGIVVHGTNGAQILNNVVHDTFGHAFMLEDGVEEDNLFQGNIGYFVNRLNALPSEYHDSTPSIFWISNPRNSFISNVAAGGEFGFWYDLPFNSLGLYKDQVKGIPNKILGTFRFNSAHSSLRGVSVDNYTPKTSTGAVSIARFDDTRVWKCNVGFWLTQDGAQIRRILASNCITAIAPAARAGDVSITDATLIGRNNENEIVTGEIVGTVLWAGYVYFSNIKCIDYYSLPSPGSRAGCISQEVFHYSQPTNNYVENLSLNNSEAVLFTRNQDTTAQSMSFIDKTGNIAQPAGQFIVPSIPFMIDDNTCNCNFEWKACACRSKYIRFEGNALNNAVTFYRADRRKADGMNISRHEDDRKIAVLTKKRYYLMFEKASPKQYSVDIWNGDQGDFIYVGICFPPGTTFSITAADFLNSKSPKTVVKKNSIKEVEDSDGFSYYFDERTGFLHLKMIFATTTPFGGSVRQNYGPRFQIQASHSSTTRTDCISKITTVEPNLSPVLPSVLVDRNGLFTKTQKTISQIQNTGAFYIAVKSNVNIVVQCSTTENRQLITATRTNAKNQQWTYEYDTGKLRCVDGGLYVGTTGGSFNLLTPIIMVKSTTQEWEFDETQWFIRGSSGANSVFDFDSNTKLVRVGRVKPSNSFWTLIPVSGTNVLDYEQDELQDEEVLQS